MPCIVFHLTSRFTLDFFSNFAAQPYMELGSEQFRGFQAMGSRQNVAECMVLCYLVNYGPLLCWLFKNRQIVERQSAGDKLNFVA